VSVATICFFTTMRLSVNGASTALSRPLTCVAERAWRFRRRAAGGCTQRPNSKGGVVETSVWPEINEAGENVGEVGVRIDAAELACLNQRSGDGSVFRAAIVTSEECILAIESNLMVILPISGRMSSSIVGIRCTDRACVLFGPSEADRLIWCTWN
jgi:hypothetical protein